MYFWFLLWRGWTWNFLSGMCDLCFYFFLFACTVNKGGVRVCYFWGNSIFFLKTWSSSLMKKTPLVHFGVDLWVLRGFILYILGRDSEICFFAYTCIGIWSCLLWSCVDVELPSVNDFGFLFVWTYDHLPVTHQIGFCFSDSDQISLFTPLYSADWWWLVLI